MGVLYLSVELALDLITALLGVILMKRAHDNGPKFWWGCIALAIGAVFAWENIGWLLIVTEEPEYRFTDLLNMEKMLKWYPMASLVALFPLASLFPGYLTARRTLLYCLPALILTLTGICYLAFDGYLTPLCSMTDVFLYWNCWDVKLRCLIFIFSIVTPLAFFLYPLLTRKGYRQANGMMYVFIGFMFVFLAIYILFTLDISYFIFNLFGATAIVFTLFFSLQYLKRENPFSVCLYDPEKVAAPVLVPSTLPLFLKIDELFQEKPLYASPHYTIKDLSEQLQVRERCLSEAIKSAGYSSFREYMNHLRLDYFRQLVVKYPDKNIKELIFLAGFNSRATFYRNFSDRYGMSPLNFLNAERIKCKN